MGFDFRFGTLPSQQNSGRTFGVFLGGIGWFWWFLRGFGWLSVGLGWFSGGVKEPPRVWNVFCDRPKTRISERTFGLCFGWFGKL